MVWIDDLFKGKYEKLVQSSILLYFAVLQTFSELSLTLNLNSVTGRQLLTHLLGSINNSYWSEKVGVNCM